MFSQIKDMKRIEQNFHSVAFSFCCQGHAPGWECRVMGESKTLAWGFAMAPHRLRALVKFGMSQNNRDVTATISHSVSIFSLNAS